MTKRDALIAVVLPFLLGGLIAASWAAIRLSTWIIAHDSVWIEMHKTNGQLEDAVASAVFALSALGLLPIEVVGAVAIMAIYYSWLWRDVRRGR